jgi:3'-5' exoribonuclease
VNPTETNDQHSPGAEEERIQKIYVKNVKNGVLLHTVFKAVTKEKHMSRSGKPYLAISLVDKTGQIDARVFENTDQAEAAFSAGEYLLVKGKIGTFHGKLQMVIDRLERLDSGPIDAAEFEYVAPPEPVKPEAAALHPAPSANDVATATAPSSSPKAMRQRILRLLDDPKVVAALDVLLTAMQGKEAAPAGGFAAAPSRRHERRERGPRVEHKPKSDDARPEKPELKRDPGLPEGLSFKPLTALVGEPPSQS